MRCANCGSENPTDSAFCEQCGRKLEQLCPACKAPVGAGARFCRRCGASLSATAIHSEAIATRPSSGAEIRLFGEQTSADVIDGERKTVTALFADIKGSTELMEDLDPEDARAIIDPALKLMIEAVGRYGGYVVQSTGDGIFALFGAPVAHEDHPQRALYAALRMQEELKRYSARVLAEGGTPIQGRVGINTGEVVVRSIQTSAGQVEYTPIGHTTNLASRMQTAAPVGSIAVSENTRRLCEGYFILKPLAATRVKGVSEPVNVYEVTGQGPLRTRLQRAAGRGLTKFVGREREMDALKHAAELARQGHGQIVAAMAEPGVGKSRLYFEFKAREGGAQRAASTGRDAGPTNWMVLETFSVSHGKASAYLPVIDLLRNYFDISGADDERKRREKVAGKITILDRSLEDTLPYLFSLLDIVEGDDPLVQMDGQIKKRRTLEAIKRILLRESLNQPLMVIFEDLHWIDEATQELLNLLADSLGTAKLLLLVNYRPEYSHKWGSKTYYTQLRLDPLGQESAEEMLSALLTSPARATQSPGASRERARPERAASAARGEVEGSEGDMDVAGRVRVQDSIEALKRLIIDKTEGNPFFMEEIVLSLFEEGALKRNGEVELAKPLASLRIPPTVQAILASRIDRLPVEEKDLLQTVAVIGSEFNLGVTRTVSGKSDDDLTRMLNNLQLAEFIYEQPATGDVEYTFKHALTHDVAYNLMLTERRKLLHEHAAQAIEALYPERLEDHLTELAYHFDRGGNLRKAVEYLGRAGQRAVEQAAFSEAMGHMKRALALIEQLPDDADRARQELELQIAFSTSLLVAEGPGSSERERALARALELCEQRRDSRMMEVILSLGTLRGARAEPLLALQLFEKALALAEQVLDPEELAAAHTGIGLQLMILGQFEAARQHLEAAIEFSGARPIRKFGQVSSMVGSAPFVLGLTLVVLGYPVTALKKSKYALETVRQHAQPYMSAAALGVYIMTHLALRDIGAVADQVEELAAITAEHDIALFQSLATFYRAWLMVNAGQVERGLSLMKQVTTQFGAHPMVNFLLVALGEVCGTNGLPEQGLAIIEDALKRCEKTPHAQAEFYRLRGELTLLKDRRYEGEVERYLLQSIEIARCQAARLFELRATTSLARLLAKQGRRAEAHRMLAGIYDWFTEGFDTADLKDAKALLDELNEAARTSDG